MGGDLVVALGTATVDGHALFGHNCLRPTGEAQTLERLPGRAHPLGERVRTRDVTLPQTRQTHTVLGVHPEGQWGFQHGLNEMGLAVGCTVVETRLANGQPSLLGSEMVRLTLERCRKARRAVDLLGDLITRYGQAADRPRDACDCAFLVADGNEAFVVETAGPYWVQQEVRQVRAVTDACTIRQDWDGIAPGLASCAIERGWWPGDGSKLDFAGALTRAAPAGALRRWGRATLLLEEQNGHIDAAFVRRVLADHYEGCGDEVDPLDPSAELVPLCRHGPVAATASSLVVELGEGFTRPPVAWWSPGPPCISVYLPVLLEAELPEQLTRGDGKGIHARMSQLLAQIGRDRRRWNAIRESCTRLQARLDQATEEFLAERARSGLPDQAERQRAARYFMEHVLEQVEETLNGLLNWRPRQTAQRSARPGRDRTMAGG